MKFFIEPFFVFKATLLDGNKLFFLKNYFLAWPIKLIMSVKHLPSKIIKLPRYMNVVTCKSTENGIVKGNWSNNSGHIIFMGITVD